MPRRFRFVLSFAVCSASCRAPLTLGHHNTSSGFRRCSEVQPGSSERTAGSTCHTSIGKFSLEGRSMPQVVCSSWSPATTQSSQALRKSDLAAFPRDLCAPEFVRLVILLFRYPTVEVRVQAGYSLTIWCGPAFGHADGQSLPTSQICLRGHMREADGFSLSGCGRLEQSTQQMGAVSDSSTFCLTLKLGRTHRTGLRVRAVMRAPCQDPALACKAHLPEQLLAGAQPIRELCAPQDKLCSYKRSERESAPKLSIRQACRTQLLHPGRWPPSTTPETLR